MEMKTLWIAVLGAAVGIGGTVATLNRGAAAAEECKTGCKTRPPAAAGACPAHFEKGKLVVTDVSEAERLRTSLMDGVLTLWVELGRAPTPEEIGRRLKLDAPATSALLDKLEACGDSATFGVLRVPQSDLIAVAWPFANVPTGIQVTLEGKKTVHARCAVDALGVSKMMGSKAVVEAITRDGVALRLEVDGDRLVSATPANAVVFKGGSCDEMLFFSSQAALDAWKSAHGAMGSALQLEEAVKHGAEFFGRFALPIRG